MFIVYVLRNSDGRLYKGVTSNLERRLREHKRGKTKTTRSMDDLDVVYTEEYEDFIKARQRELYLKSAAGRRFLRKVLGS